MVPLFAGTVTRLQASLAEIIVFVGEGQHGLKLCVVGPVFMSDEQTVRALFCLLRIVTVTKH